MPPPRIRLVLGQSSRQENDELNGFRVGAGKRAPPDGGSHHHTNSNGYKVAADIIVLSENKIYASLFAIAPCQYLL